MSIARAAATEVAARHLPRRALVVILATGFQESGVRNLAYGDRDSVGWLQQRAGWGSVAERMNPQTAAGKFFDHLVRVPGWETLPVAAAAQAVQVSAFPDAYAKWQSKAEQLAALVAGPDTGSGSSAGQDAACTGMPAVRVATWNSYYGAKHAGASGPTGEARITFAMLALGREADIIGGQEFSEASHKDAAMAGLGDDWAAAALDTSHPVFYRKTFALVSSESVPVFKRGTPMEGPDQGDRYVNTVVLREAATGQTVTEINFHEIPTIQKHGQAERGVAEADRGRPPHLRGRDGQRTGPHRAGQPGAGDVRLQLRGRPRRHVQGRRPDVSLERVRPVEAGDPVPRHRPGPVLRRDADVGEGPPGLRQRPLPARRHVPRHPGQQRWWRGQCRRWSGAGVVQPAGQPPHRRAGGGVDAGSTPRGAAGEPVQGACERYMNLAYGLGGGYPTALAHWNAAGPRSGGYSTPPRGALVFWRTSNPAGHVALSLGNGIVVSTDYNAQTHRWQAGMLSAGPITDLDRWGPRLGWRAPNFRAGSEGA